MYWIAGYHGQTPTPRRPLGGRKLWAVGDSVAWVVGDAPAGALRLATAVMRDVAVIGVSGASPEDLDRLASRGVPDDAVTRWSGSYIVAERTAAGTSPSTDLSGGLDSTALTLLAAEALSPDRSVAAFTVHRPSSVPVGDLRYAIEAADRPGIEHHRLRLGPDHLPYGQLDALPPTDEPAPSGKAYARLGFQLDAMRDLVGTDAHLTGDGGDAVLSTPIAWIGDLLRRGGYGRAVLEAVRVARVRRTTPRAVLVRAAIAARSRPSDALAAQARIWRNGYVLPRDRRAAREWVTAGAQACWLTEGARLLAADLADEAAARVEHIAPGNVSRHLVAQAAVDVGRTAQADAQLAAHHGVVLHNPFVDSRILDVCLSVPVAHLAGPSAYKPVLRRALCDLYPSSLVARTTKGTFTSDYYQGLRTNLPSLLDLADGRLARLGIIDAEPLRATLEAAAAGAPTALYTLDTVLGIEAWMAVVESAHEPSWWSDAAARIEVGAR